MEKIVVPAIVVQNFLENEIFSSYSDFYKYIGKIDTNNNTPISNDDIVQFNSSHEQIVSIPVKMIISVIVQKASLGSVENFDKLLENEPDHYVHSFHVDAALRIIGEIAYTESKSNEKVNIDELTREKISAVPLNRAEMPNFRELRNAWKNLNANSDQTNLLSEGHKLPDPSKKSPQLQAVKDTKKASGPQSAGSSKTVPKQKPLSLKTPGQLDENNRALLIDLMRSCITDPTHYNFLYLYLGLGGNDILEKLIDTLKSGVVASSINKEAKETILEFLERKLNKKPTTSIKQTNPLPKRRNHPNITKCFKDIIDLGRYIGMLYLDRNVNITEKEIKPALLTILGIDEKNLEVLISKGKIFDSDVNMAARVLTAFKRQIGNSAEFDSSVAQRFLSTSEKERIVELVSQIPQTKSATWNVKVRPSETTHQKDIFGFKQVKTEEEFLSKIFPLLPLAAIKYLSIKYKDDYIRVILYKLTRDQRVLMDSLEPIEKQVYSRIVMSIVSAISRDYCAECTITCINVSIAEETDDYLASCICQLPSKYAEVCNKYYIDNMSITTISNVTGIDAMQVERILKAFSNKTGLGLKASDVKTNSSENETAIIREELIGSIYEYLTIDELRILFNYYPEIYTRIVLPNLSPFIKSKVEESQQISDLDLQNLMSRIKRLKKSKYDKRGLDAFNILDNLELSNIEYEGPCSYLEKIVLKLDLRTINFLKDYLGLFNSIPLSTKEMEKKYGIKMCTIKWHITRFSNRLGKKLNGFQLDTDKIASALKLFTSYERITEELIGNIYEYLTIDELRILSKHYPEIYTRIVLPNLSLFIKSKVEGSHQTSDLDLQNFMSRIKRLKKSKYDKRGLDAFNILDDLELSDIEYKDPKSYLEKIVLKLDLRTTNFLIDVYGLFNSNRLSSDALGEKYGINVKRKSNILVLFRKKIEAKLQNSELEACQIKEVLAQLLLQVKRSSRNVKIRPIEDANKLFDKGIITPEERDLIIASDVSNQSSRNKQNRLIGMCQLYSSVRERLNGMDNLNLSDIISIFKEKIPSCVSYNQKYIVNIYSDLPESKSTYREIAREYGLTKEAAYTYLTMSMKIIRRVIPALDLDQKLQDELINYFSMTTSEKSKWEKPVVVVHNNIGEIINSFSDEEMSPHDKLVLMLFYGVVSLNGARQPYNVRKMSVVFNVSKDEMNSELILVLNKFRALCLEKSLEDKPKGPYVNKLNGTI